MVKVHEDLSDTYEKLLYLFSSYTIPACVVAPVLRNHSCPSCIPQTGWYFRSGPWVSGHRLNWRPVVVRHGPGPSARVTLLWGGADADTVGPFQAVVEVGHVVLVDAAAALTDAVVTVDAEVEVLATGWEIPCFCTVFFFKVFEGFIYNIIC